jgi:predicted nucleic acid-binding Zn finger protein
VEILTIKRSKAGTGLKVYGTILGDHGKTYRFAYCRRPTFRGWLCSCESFVLNLFAKGRNCKHLHKVRAEYGRFGTLVPR